MSSVTRASLDEKRALAKHCSREGVLAGAKAAAVATVVAAIPTLVDVSTWRKLKEYAKLKLASVKMSPWARANLNPIAQALIISTAAGMAYFIVADKTVLALARKNSFQTATAAHRHN